MLLSESHRFIFIHIPKTAGTSVMGVFLPYSRFRDRLYYGYRPTRKLIRIAIDHCGWEAGRQVVTGFHKHCQAVAVRDGLGAERYAKYFAFSFVRNPYDLLESLYFFIQQSQTHHFSKQVSRMSFEEFIVWYLRGPSRSQMRYLRDPKTGEWLVDYVGRFESLSEDVGAITKKLGIPFSGDLPHQNTGRLRKRSREDLWSEASRELVRKHYADDFRILGYSETKEIAADAIRWTGRNSER